jgi:uncharacterized protein (TIGR00251 family)
LKISVIVRPNSRREGIVPPGDPDGAYTVRVAAPPVEGRANERVIELVAGHFGVPKSRVSIARGARGRKKIVEILR